MEGQQVNPVEHSLKILSEKWEIDPRVYDFELGRRDDVTETRLSVDGVIFHIPTLSREGLYVVWKCLWPDCHNCCERQGRLPLTTKDMEIISRKLGYHSLAKFLQNETTISSWEEHAAFGNLITNLTMISLKRKPDESESEDGTPLRCRHLDNSGSCQLHPDKPGVCWLYPFASWLESDADGKAVAHATFQFTGDCPGFYLDKSLDGLMQVLKEYAPKIFDYNMAVSRTGRQNYSSISFVNLNS
ncbi:MAG: YkgJ family cysteine cluster protein [Nitrososphaera sp.]